MSSKRKSIESKEYGDKDLGKQTANDINNHTEDCQDGDDVDNDGDTNEDVDEDTDEVIGEDTRKETDMDTYEGIDEDNEDDLILLQRQSSMNQLRIEALELELLQYKREKEALELQQEESNSMIKALELENKRGRAQQTRPAAKKLFTFHEHDHTENVNNNEDNNRDTDEDIDEDTDEVNGENTSKETDNDTDEDIDEDNEDDPILLRIYRACRGNRKIGSIECMIQQIGVLINMKDYDGKTPLHFACMNGRADVVEKLLQNENIHVNCIDVDGNTPLHDAANICCYSVIQHLIEFPLISINITNRSNKTPLNLAMENYIASATMSTNLIFHPMFNRGARTAEWKEIVQLFKEYPHKLRWNSYFYFLNDMKRSV